MIAKFMTRSKQITFEIEADTQTALFEELASVQEVFDAEPSCGICQSPHKFLHRISKGYDFYELVCTNPECRARFEFGQTKEPKGGLFPKRKDKDDKWKPNRGWSKYQTNQPQDRDGTDEGWA